MYFKQKSNVIFRNYDSFGYITDNRNFGYKGIDSNQDVIGDKIVSKSGAIFLSALNRTPQTIDELAEKICKQFKDINAETIKADAVEFYSLLEADGFIVSGNTMQECIEKESFPDKRLCGKRVDICMQNKIPENSTQIFFDKYFNGKPQLVSIHMEITSRCNERCIHCYIPHEKKTNIMNSNMFYNILDQAREMNVLHLTLSGGEPMIHANFTEFLKKCNEYNFSVNILSNLTLLKLDILEEMKQNPLVCVQTSLYSMNPDIHDSITQEDGSFEKTKSNILKLIEANIPVQISCPIIKQNMHCYKDVVAWGKNHNINVSCDPVIIAKYDHSVQNLNCRLSIDDFRRFISQKATDNPQYVNDLHSNRLKKRNMKPDDNICSVCRASICISETGNVYPCVGWQDYVLGNIKDSSLQNIWTTSKKIEYLRNLQIKDFPQCTNCPDKEFCTICMVRNANEDSTGNPLSVNQYFCNVAKINKEVYYEQNIY